MKRSNFHLVFWTLLTCFAPLAVEANPAMPVPANLQNVKMQPHFGWVLGCIDKCESFSASCLKVPPGAESPPPDYTHVPGIAQTLDCAEARVSCLRKWCNEPVSCQFLAEAYLDTLLDSCKIQTAVLGELSYDCFGNAPATKEIFLNQCIDESRENEIRQPLRNETRRLNRSE